ncbi:monovalent cation/H(+) antiporter subunit G [Planococcus sp. N028]|uniref:Monovalent cation/H(+) antiporter subunit G n=1 Tax=Planococcus shixiaomingii TaxID=3058393 RepID=A0ABT8N7A4_9BACL|nr:MULTISPECIES: monovalent cation/H(+) antiporter subunit G [unclassified Planococcus (in: firmicutes)]MDN7243608.1 monovalent cation/H(+) antiporter subunit G [Planococcus sp. N028]WKA56043.1 monovalent cation/H(+) antiporter subunit G [Planococcus sp. N022]
MEIIADVLVIFFISVGVILSVVAALGLVRFPDVYTRTHAASKSSTLGVLCILFGTFLHFLLIENHFNTELIIAIAFLFITSPVAGHLIGRASYVSGIKLADVTVRDDLKGVIGPKVNKKK